MLVLAISVIACSKNDDNEDIQDVLNIKEITNLIDKSVSEVKKTIKGELIDEKTTLGVTKLSYHLVTKEAKYIAIFRFNEEGILTKSDVVPDEKFSYSSCVNLMKTISDRIAALYPEKKYIGYAGYASYDVRSKYWDAVSKDSTKYMFEYWFLIDEADIREVITLAYATGNTFEFSIEKKLY